MRQSIRVLHVDDDPEFAAVAAQHLQREHSGMSVETVTSVGDAIDCLDRDGIDCVISDYEMPECDGIEFLSTVREHHPDIPFVLFTGKGSEEVASEAISAGVDDYVQKVTDTEQYEVLANRIENLVAQARARTTYREVFDKAAVGLTVHDTNDGTFLDVNERYCELLGYSREEAIELSLGDVSAGTEGFTADRARELIRGAADDEVTTFEWLDETKDGDEIWVEVGLREATIEGHDRVLASVRDVTERKERERELAAAKRRYAALFEHTTDAIAWVEFERERPIIRDVNPAFERLFAAKGEEVIGHDIDDVVAAPHQRDQARELTRRTMAGETMRGTLTRETVAGPREFLWHAVPVNDPESDGIEAGFAVYSEVTDTTLEEAEGQR